MDQKTLSQKLYFMEGMSVDKISSMLDLRKSEVEDYIKQQVNFQIKNGQGSYEFRLLREGAGSKYSGGNYIEFFNSASGQWTAMHDFDQYFRINGLVDLPDMRVFLEYFFGTAKKSSDYKNTFIFDFELKPKEMDEVFLLSIYDVKGGLNFNFFNDQTKDNPAELSEFEIETIEFFFIALIKNAANFVRENELQIKDFYDAIYDPPCIYGYQNNEAFFKSFDNRDDFNLERRELEKEMNKEIEIIGEPNIPAAQMIVQANQEVQNYELTKLYEKVYINIGDVILDNRFILKKYPEIYKVLHDLKKYCLLVNLLLDSDKDLAEQRVNRYFKAETVETISDEVIILLAEATKDFLESNYSSAALAYIFSNYRAEVKELLETDDYQDIKKINDAVIDERIYPEFFGYKVVGFWEKLTN
ncbi:hypothetical protein HSACCH_02471 [Halanaerobium saccharolyticum subsp. saccharolyticum DSM 6643]|uniref:Uncharacterized protein n=1 Tax=Halanaerobium saccharolyticum subsp. saccharolyticum DSM 6643 TaxID=1293054 RepID=M5E357_9FIRM|nr:hypothetical protein [Halanaerobium saccharolyticum]CCU80972.1 hypothetical protein HSACCH_02471 [Halanaerobium saccharolyticum subsp. saccharolyticum DSM 6643]